LQADNFTHIGSRGTSVDLDEPAPLDLRDLDGTINRASFGLDRIRGFCIARYQSWTFPIFNEYCPQQMWCRALPRLRVMQYSRKIRMPFDYKAKHIAAFYCAHIWYRSCRSTVRPAAVSRHRRTQGRQIGIGEVPAGLSSLYLMAIISQCDNSQPIERKSGREREKELIQEPLVGGLLLFLRHRPKSTASGRRRRYSFSASRYRSRRRRGCGGAGEHRRSDSGGASLTPAPCNLRD
jgi:hypothetical protein